MIFEVLNSSTSLLVEGLPQKMSLVRDMLPTLNNGQFVELLPLFSNENNRLFYLMTVEQAISYREAILEQHQSLLMRVFLGELQSRGNAVERPLKHARIGGEDREDELTASHRPRVC